MTAAMQPATVSRLAKLPPVLGSDNPAEVVATSATSPPTPVGLAGRNDPPANYTGRTDDALWAEGDITRYAAASMLDGHDKVVLAYSGGAESGLLLHLLRQFRQRLIVQWVNPGAPLHEAEHVRRQAAGGPFVEVASDQRAYWAEHGLPSFLVPVDRMTAFEKDTLMEGLPISPATSCCIEVRNNPGRIWCAANGVGMVIHGQRRGEGSGMYGIGIFPPHWGPLATWTRQEVMRRVAHHSVSLPMQYVQSAPESFECSVCPAKLDPGRLAFLRQHYPDDHAETLRLAGEVHGIVARSYRGAEKALKAAGVGQ